MCSYVTYNLNQVVYIKGIGYGTLVKCGKYNQISIKTQNMRNKRDSIYFDPNLFDLEGETNNQLKRSDTQEKQQQKIENSNDSKQGEQVKKQQSKLQIVNREVNIVSVRLQNTQFMVYTDDINITKTICLIIKPIFVKKLNQIVITIEIGKNIEYLKKFIFQKLDEPLISYYNVRLFTTIPVLSQLNVWTKLISAYSLKDGQKIIIQAQYAFGFSDIPQKNKKDIVLSNGGNSIARVSQKPIQLKVAKTETQSKAIEQKRIVPIQKIVQINKIDQIPEIVKDPEGEKVVQPEKIEKIVQLQKPAQIIDNIQVDQLNKIFNDSAELIASIELQKKRLLQELQNNVKNNEEIQDIREVQQIIEIAQLQKAAEYQNQMMNKQLQISQNMFSRNPFANRDKQESPNLPLPNYGSNNWQQEPLPQVRQKLIKQVKQIEAQKMKQNEKVKQENQLIKLIKKEASIDNIIFNSCKVQFCSGKHYWQFKIDKATAQDDIWIGVRQNQTNIFAYLPLCGKKYMNNQLSDYGYISKHSDIIGVLLHFNYQGKASLSFYKNSVSCENMAINLQGPLEPIVGLGKESQVTIDSKAQFPIDSYRNVK